MEESPEIPPLRTEIVDGVERYPRTGIRVLVAGGGIGGLMAALECWRKGHEVRVIERSPEVSSLGDFFTLGPSGLTTLKYYPNMFSDYMAVLNDADVTVLTRDGSVLVSKPVDWNKDGAKHRAGDFKISMFNTRSSIAKMQHDQCERLGIPIEFGKRVIKYSEDMVAGDATVETETGAKYSADIIIAADGIGTKSNAIVRGSEVKAIPSGEAILRKIFPRDQIQPDSPAAALLPKDGERPHFDVYPGPNMHIMIFLDKEHVGIALTHPDIGLAAESWSKPIQSSIVVDKLEEMGNWSPAITDLFKQMPGKAIDWKLTWRDPQPVWTSRGGRIVQLGDAAHSFLPSSGNGATQALEDALSLAECLRLGGREHAHLSTKVHERLRFKRTSTIQRFGFHMKNTLHHMLDASGLNLAVDPSKMSIGHGKWVWQHDPAAYASEKYALAYAHIRTGAPFEDTNLPPGFVYRPWTMDEELEKEAKGEPSDLTSNGDWSVE